MRRLRSDRGSACRLSALTSATVAQMPLEFSACSEISLLDQREPKAAKEVIEAVAGHGSADDGGARSVPPPYASGFEGFGFSLDGPICPRISISDAAWASLSLAPTAVSMAAA